MALLPLTLEMTGRLCLVVGGGDVATRKVRDALAAGARVRVVTPETTGELDDLDAAGRIDLVRGRFDPGHLDGIALAFVATDDETVNEAASRAAKARGILVNVADRPPLCDFHVPALVRRGDLLIAVSTSGKSPALAARVRRRLEAEFGPEYERLIALLGETRALVAARAGLSQRDRQAIYERIVDGDVLALLKDGRDDEAKALVRRTVEEGRG
jgi:precorrin-2 dehydrogenase/sirohydrochlorin ferrochelatase